MSDLQIISDDSDLRKYRIELPNIVDDLGLTPSEGRLYMHYKRVCGANGGTCTEGTRGTGRRVKMSVGQVSKARDGLADRGLITKIESGQYVHVKIVDIWELNFAYFLTEDRPDIAGWTIKRLRDYLKSVHNMNTSIIKRSPDEHLTQKRSPDEHSVHNMNTSSEKCSYYETKKEHKNKNKPIEGGEKPAPDSSKPIQDIPWQAVVTYTEITGLKLDRIQGKAIIELAEQSPDFNLARWTMACTTTKLAGVLPANIACRIDVYKAGGNYQAMKERKRNGQPDTPAPRPVSLDNGKAEAYRALMAADQAAAAETKERVNGIMAGEIKAAGLDVERQIKKAQGRKN